jgi:endonuclease/exonuclease/phosphatase (EEP) superfamily protein YafD
MGRLHKWWLELRGGATVAALVVTGVLLLVSRDIGLPGQALLQSIRFHVVALMLPLVLILLVGRAWIRALLFTVVAGFSIYEGGSIVASQQALRSSVADAGTRPLFTFIGFNLLTFNENGAQLADLLTGSDADILLTMESDPIYDHMDQMRATFPYVSPCVERICDVRLFSRVPLENVRVRSVGGMWKNRFVLAEAEIDGVRFTIAAAHLTKPYFDHEAAEEISAITHALGEIKGPLLLAGDFNAAAWSDAVARMARRAELAPGPGYPATWPVRSGPLGVPIDNVFARAPLVITDIEALPDAMGSNHRGLRASISVAAP